MAGWRRRLVFQGISVVAESIVVDCGGFGGRLWVELGS